MHQDAEEARRRFQDGFRFFQFALGWHYGFGEQIPGRTDIWEKFQKAPANMAAADAGGRRPRAASARPTSCASTCASSRTCGVDQVAFIQQGGRNKHEHICEALELFAGEVMGEFKEREAERGEEEGRGLAPFVEAAFKRKKWMKPLADDEIPPVLALGRQVAEQAARRRRAAGRRPRAGLARGGSKSARPLRKSQVEVGDGLSARRLSAIIGRSSTTCWATSLTPGPSSRGSLEGAGLVEQAEGAVEGGAERRRPAAQGVDDGAQRRQGRAAGLPAVGDDDAAHRAAVEIGPGVAAQAPPGCRGRS